MKQAERTPITTPPLTAEPWRSRAACRFTESELFFPDADSGQSLLQVTQARAICAGCAVRRECLAFAVRTHQSHGIWGGLTEQERRAGGAGRSADAPEPNTGRVRPDRTPALPGGHELFEAQAMAARIACHRVARPALTAIRDSVNSASSLSARPEWASKATAHAEIFQLLADTAGDYAVATELRGMAGLVRDLMVAVGPTADGIVISSRKRLLACLYAGDNDGAATEMEDHLRMLRFMGRLAGRSTPLERPA
ncbi:MAG TPA: WhiB family transcriptional regulator [Trebonia sp.]|jgi:WhiB family redox-sensing transcriptional regulator|nr:WhiB family transcriptional regulator [Trebonia sp.]